MQIEFFPEMCCDICMDTIHNHMDCPECKHKYAGTDCYGNIYELELGETLSCEECDAKFKLISKEALWIDDYIWEKA